MAGAMSRNKGSTFEREVAKRLHEELGIKFMRNLRQYQEGGFDLVPLDPEVSIGYEIECKRRKRISISDAFRLYNEANVVHKKEVMLFFREDYGDIFAVVDIEPISEVIFTYGRLVIAPAIIGFTEAAFLLRESIS